MIRIVDMSGRAPSRDEVCSAEIGRRASRRFAGAGQAQACRRTIVIHPIDIMGDDVTGLVPPSARPRSDFELFRDIARALGSSRIPVCGDCRAIDVVTGLSDGTRSAGDHAAVMAPCGWISAADGGRDDACVSTQIVALDLDALLDPRGAGLQSV